MTPAAAFLRGGQVQLAKDFGDQTATWHGKEMVVIPSEFEGGLSVGVGPKGEELTARLFVLRDNFLTVDSTIITIDSDLFTVDDDRPTPVAGKTIIFRGKTRRIVSAKEDGALSGYTLDLAPMGKG